MALFEKITEFHAGVDAIRRRRYGVIETVSGRLAAVYLRPWPKLISLGEIWLQEMFFHRGREADRCLLYYDQPLTAPRFLAIKYFVSSRGATLRTVAGAAAVLDEIARLKRIDALVCEAWNRRLSDRLLQRWGWERHLAQSRRRHYIKRFYGSYPHHPEFERLIVGQTREHPNEQLALPQGGGADYYSAPYAGAVPSVQSRGEGRHATHNED